MIAYLEELDVKKERKEGIYLDLEYAFNLCKQCISTLKNPSKSISDAKT
jgi:hypothetical protein